MDGLARFLQLRGRRVVEACGALWHSAGHGLYMSFPYHRRLDLDPLEAREALRPMGALGVRYPSLTWAGLASGLYVCRRRDYDIPALHRNFRAHIRHGLPLCEVRRLSERELAEEALRINLNGMRRQGRYDPEFGDAGRWRTFARAVAESPAITAVGAFVGGRLASYAVACREGAWLDILYRMTDLQFAQCHSSQVLDFTITRGALRDPGIEAVSMGWSPLVPNAGLHEYKIRLGYACEPQYSVIQLRPAFEFAMAASLTRAALRVACLAGVRSEALRMARAVAEGARLTRESVRARTAAPMHQGGTDACR